MIGSWLPQGVFTPHPMAANQSIHDGVLECVAHMQAASYVWRWDNDAKRIAISRGGKNAARLPLLV